MSPTTKATIVTLALAVLVELSLSRALLESDVIASILGGELLVPGAILVLYLARGALLVTVATLAYRFSSWACRRGERAS